MNGTEESVIRRFMDWYLYSWKIYVILGFVALINAAVGAVMFQRGPVFVSIAFATGVFGIGLGYYNRNYTSYND